MAPLNFPTAPTNGQKYPDPAPAGGHQWSWDGAKWMLVAAAPSAPQAPSADDAAAAAQFTVTGSINDAGTAVTIGGKNYKYWEFHGDGTITCTKAGWVSALLVGGGGSGTGYGAGGGAGAFLEVDALFLTAAAHPVHVGKGGVAAATGNVIGSPGHPSTIGLYSAAGGGPGGATSSPHGFLGGSGGGSHGAGKPGERTPGQGNIGGQGGSGTFGSSGGGGGAGGPGLPAANGNGGNGGPGKTSNITGTPRMMAAGGGGGGSERHAGGVGGSGIGGNAGREGPNVLPTVGTPNTGSGGGGHPGSNSFDRPGSNGTDGIVIVRVAV